MIDLNKEAENYCNNNYPHYLNKKEALLVQEDFIAGVNSKYVQAKILQAQIEENRSILRMLKLHGNAKNRLPVLMRVNELEQQLENLKYEKL